VVEKVTYVAMKGKRNTFGQKVLANGRGAGLLRREPKGAEVEKG